ncbi:MAG: hypothetical protein GXP63_04095 [DPANN group archaeon]|nr:hypothetical protein [DPANN group archaeon]
MTKKVPCEVYSRIVGYFRPVENWNEGKKQEFQDRKVFVPQDMQQTSEQLMTAVEMQPTIS